MNPFWNDSLSNFQWSRSDKELEAAGEEGILVTDLIEDPAALTDEDLKFLKEVAVKEDVLRNRLISPSANVSAINIEVKIRKAFLVFQ